MAGVSQLKVVAELNVPPTTFKPHSSLASHAADPREGGCLQLVLPSFSGT